MPTIKIVDFKSAQSWAILPSKMVRRLEPNFLPCNVSLRVQVCLHLAIEEKFRGLRLRKCQMILNRIVSPIYREFLTKISRPGVRSGRCWRISNTQTDVTLWCRVTFWPRDSNAIFKGKWAQLCSLVKWTIFIAENSNFEIVYFERYIFILCGKQLRFRDTLKNDTNSWNLVEFPKLEVSPQKEKLSMNFF